MYSNNTLYYNFLININKYFLVDPMFMTKWRTFYVITYTRDLVPNPIIILLLLMIIDNIPNDIIGCTIFITLYRANENNWP